MSEKPTCEELEKRIRELEKAGSERKQAEKAQKESEKRYRTFINSTSDLVFLKDSEFNYIVFEQSHGRFLW